MSNPTETTPVQPLDLKVEPATQESPEEKQSFVHKTKHFVKTHKKRAIAGAALVGLVGVAAVTGRKTAPTEVFIAGELTPVEETDGVYIVTDDDTVTTD